MSTSTEPDGSPPGFASTAEAFEWLGCTPKTARRRIDRGELDGKKTKGGHYYFRLPPRYLKGPHAQPGALDAVGEPDPPVVDDDSQLRAELAAARQLNNELHARLAAAEQERATAEARRVAAEDVQRRLLAANTLTIEAAKKLSKSSQLAQESSGLAREGSDDLWQAVEIQRDLLAEHLTPDDLSKLPDLPLR
ncbi:MerR family transcriptional regulator [Mycobacteroides abscessus]|uniref:hypothetical protein n=1 Tax=Mycobacteroides abscessus TaxID=36809 RepID=UPI00092A63ED|nr:hypothetical protein [Mycobacteroides abscessus]SHQ45601.1 Uncharacterised protein [Mycobacteroides abscessus subsp. abscessus]SKQ87563.1 Uncharacterised protein [Mycobacteroides abscessus subsp. massiliense]SLC51838.1 Uncharacterised protein [Mycobacteroides abscessus subsp. massiliense]